MRKIFWISVVVGAILVSNIAVAFYAHFARPKFDETLLGLWGFRALACGKGFQVVTAFDPQGFAFEVKEGFLGHARSSGASDDDIEHLQRLFDGGREAAIKSGFVEGIEFDPIGVEMEQIIGSLVNHGCGVDTHFVIERDWLSIDDRKDELFEQLLNQ